MSLAQDFHTSRRDFIKLMSSLGLVALTESGCALLVPIEQQPLAKIALREPRRTGRLDEAQLSQLWKIFDFIGEGWEMPGLCTLQNLDQLKSIIILKTTRSPSYLTEYQSALKIFQKLRENLEPQQALQHFYFKHRNEHLKRYVILEFLRLHIAHGGFRFLPFKNVVGFAGGTFSDEERLPYRGLGDSC